MQDAARACRYTAFDEDKRTGLLRHVVLRCSRKGQVLVTLVTPRPELPGSRNFCAALRKKSAVGRQYCAKYQPHFKQRCAGQPGENALRPRLCAGHAVRAAVCHFLRSFYQVNPRQTEVLYRAALAAAKLTGKETVVDAYCGIGTIGLCAAPHAGQVIGVERNPAAVKDAAANARHNKLSNAKFVCADATEWMAAAADEGLHPDVVFLDPPRAGSTPSASPPWPKCPRPGSLRQLRPRDLGAGCSDFCPARV